MIIKTGLGQDSHQFEKISGKDLVLAGVKFDYPFGLKGNSDADVVFHSITNSISSITGKNILGDVADQLAKKGKKDSSKYLQIALEDLGDWKINHIAVALECAKPKISNHVEAIKESIANICKINVSDVGITATSGEGLTSFGRGEGIQAITIITVSKS
jgi:2-C-methyl-D-erythritol 2,4-cyclodiphosphate synthase